MRRRHAFVLGAAIFVAACGGGGGGSKGASTTVDNPVAGVAVSTTVQPVVRTPPPTVATTAIPLAGTAAPAPETTAPATTVALPQPIAPPAENAVDPTKLVGKIEIPKIGIDENMYEGIALSTLDKGPGHWPGTAMPGEPGNVVVAGHRVSHSKPFRHIDDLVDGDQVKFTINGTVFTYVVTGHEIVDPTAIRIVDQTPEPTATLFACHPPGSVAERYVVHLALQA
ncbi:MAG TPA: sortase [Acidimicrobiales bacterium]|jgi:sortase A